MSRKNLYQLFEERELTAEQGFDLLYSLLEDSIRDKNYTLPKNITIKEIINNFIFSKTKLSQGYKNFCDFMNSMNLIRKNNITFDDVFLLIEVIYYIVKYTNNNLADNDITDTSYKRLYDKFCKEFDKKFKYILNKTNHQLIQYQNQNKFIVVPLDYKTDQAVMLVMNQNEDIAYEFYNYNHFSNFGKLEEKKKILTNIANYFDKELSGTIGGNLVNNFHIRHNNKEGINKNDYMQNMCGEELEKWYDRIFNELVYFVIEKEHKKTEKLLNEIQAKDKE